jgi:uncharacterized protein (UPF0297 family)
MAMKNQKKVGEAVQNQYNLMIELNEMKDKIFHKAQVLAHDLSGEPNYICCFEKCLEVIRESDSKQADQLMRTYYTVAGQIIATERLGTALARAGFWKGGK